MIKFAAGLIRRFPVKGSAFIWEKMVPYLKREPDTVVSFPEGFKMRLDTRDHWQRAIYAGCYERREHWLISRLLRPGDVFIDAGAHLGYYTLTAAARVGREGKVYAFDPFPDMVEILKKQKELNPHLSIIIEEKALSSSGGKRFFYMPSDHDFYWERGMASLSEHLGWKKKEVTCATLDEYLESNKIKSVRLCKLDVERAESEVLKGARRSLESGVLESLIVEVVADTKAAVLDEIKRYSFEIYYDMEHYRPLFRFEDVKIKPNNYVSNILCARGLTARRWKKLGLERFFY